MNDLSLEEMRSIISLVTVLNQGEVVLGQEERKGLELFLDYSYKITGQLQTALAEIEHLKIKLETKNS